MSKFVFVCGKYRDTSAERIANNLLQAEVMGSLLLQHAYIPLIPMTTFPHYHNIPYLNGLNDTEWMHFYIMPLIDISFALIRLGNWEQSQLAPQEVAYAKSKGIHIVDSIEDLLTIELRGGK